MTATGPVEEEKFKPPVMTHLSVIADRKPKRKFHKNLGQAKNAVGYSQWNGVRGGEIWEVAEPDNILLYSVAPSTHKNDLPWRETK